MCPNTLCQMKRQWGEVRRGLGTAISHAVRYSESLQSLPLTATRLWDLPLPRVNWEPPRYFFVLLGIIKERQNRLQSITYLPYLDSFGCVSLCVFSGPVFCWMSPFRSTRTPLLTPPKFTVWHRANILLITSALQNQISNILVRHDAVTSGQHWLWLW